MKTYIHLWYLAQFVLEWEILHIKLVKKIKTHILRSITLFLFENPAVYEMWKNALHPYSPQIAITRMRTACWIPKVTNTHTHTHTHSEYVIIITFSTATRVARTRLNVTWPAHCLSCYYYRQERYFEIHFLTHHDGSPRNHEEMTRKIQACRQASVTLLVLAKDRKQQLERPCEERK